MMFLFTWFAVLTRCWLRGAPVPQAAVELGAMPWVVVIGCMRRHRRGTHINGPRAELLKGKKRCRSVGSLIEACAAVAVETVIFAGGVAELDSEDYLVSHMSERRFGAVEVDFSVGDCSLILVLGAF